MGIRFIIIYISALMLSFTAYGQATQAAYDQYAGRADIVAAGSKLQPRSALTPFQSREEAIGKDTRSPYVIPSLQWSRDSSTDAVRYTARFKKHFSWDDRAVILRIEDVTSSFRVDVNDSTAGYSQAGMGRSEFDITKWTRPDYNTVSVTIFPNSVSKRIEHGRSEVDPSIGRASVISQPTVRIDDLFIRSSHDRGNSYINLDVVTQSILLNPKEYVLHYELLDPEGRTVAMSQKELHAGGMMSRDTTSFVITVADPRHWNHETPNLYTLLVTSRNEGKVKEVLALRIGIRSSGYTTDGITIDGMPTPMYAVRYAANPDAELTAAKLRQFKSDGYNLIITDGYSQPDYFYSLCDAIGLYVCDEADIDTGTINSGISEGFDNPGNSPQWTAAYLDRMAHTYYSSHIHPSVIMYSPAKRSANGYGMYEAYMMIKDIDSSLPVFYTGADGQWNNDVAEAALSTKPQRSDISAGGNDVSAAFDNSTSTLKIRNNRNFTTAKGTCKITVRNGRKRVASHVESFELSGSETLEIEIPEASLLKGTGSIDVELHSLKNAGGAYGDDRKTTVKDLYNTSNQSFPL